MSDFFVLSGVILAAVFAALVDMVQHLREDLKIARRANEYLARRLTSDLYARRERVLTASDEEVLACRKEIDRELREYLYDEPPDPNVWAGRGNPRSYR